MQKFITGDGMELIGREALMDTMEDLIVDVLGALVVAIVGYFDLRKKHNQPKIYTKEQTI